MKKIILKEGEKISFISKTKKYGCAEFDFCPIFKYGKLKKVFIFPRQQPDKDCYYEVKCFDQKEFQISSWTHKGIENPNIWLMHWCKEHKTVCYSVYPDIKCNHLEISQNSTFVVRFVREDLQLDRKEKEQ